VQPAAAVGRCRAPSTRILTPSYLGEGLDNCRGHLLGPGLPLQALSEKSAQRAVVGVFGEEGVVVGESEAVVFVGVEVGVGVVRHALRALGGGAIGAGGEGVFG
jgi:hypothetical protein